MRRRRCKAPAASVRSPALRPAFFLNYRTSTIKLSRLSLAAAAFSLALLTPTLARAVSTAEAETVKIGKAIDTKSVKMLFKKKNRAVMAGYQVAFVTRNKATAAAGLYGSGARATMETFLGNVDYALMQEIVDAAYANHVKRLQEAGIEIVPMEQVKASKAFQELEVTPGSAAQPCKVNLQGADYVVVPASGFPLWFNKYDDLGAKGEQSKKNIQLMAQLSKEFDAAVLQPSFGVDFTYLDTSGGSLRRKANVEAQNSMLIVPTASVYWGSVEYLAYPKFLDGFWAEGATGKFITAEEANNRGLVESLGRIGIDIGPVRSKKAVVLEADREAFKAKSVELLNGTAVLFKRAVQDARD